MKEIWLDIPKFKNYQASNLGNVRCLNFRNLGITKVLKQSYDKDGYKKVNLNCNSYRTHRIIAMAFLENYSDDLQVNHKNGIKDDNNINNLEMVTNKENSLHRTNVLKVGRIKSVLMLDKSTLKPIKKFNSTREAERIMNIEHSTISKVCNGKKRSAGGYFWQFIERDDKKWLK